MVPRTRQSEVKVQSTLKAFGLVFSAALALTGSDAAAAPSPGENHTKVSFVAEVSEVLPGAEFRVAVVFDIEDGWHTYWNGLNDTGMPTTIDLTLPRGFERDDIRWPVPERYIMGRNDMIDHVYKGRAVHVIPVKAPEEIGEGGTVTITADIEWLVCKEACLPGWKSLTLTLPVGSARPGVSAKPSDAAPLFRWADARTPRPFEKAKESVRVDRSGEVVTIRAAGAEGLEFYPGPGSAELYDRFNDPVADGDTLRLRLRPGSDLPLKGVLRIKSPPPAPDPEGEPGSSPPTDPRPSFAVTAFHIESPAPDEGASD
ncbi:MAG: hypothetical protein JJU33_00600 [Phycisphaerales bacterium]|nr:hypothetical protein [Phycisphaerales bacterium]